MNPTLELLNRRKSVRVYTEQEISSECRQAILNAAIQAPSAGNMTMYTILNITDPAIQAALAESCFHHLLEGGFVAAIGVLVPHFSKDSGQLARPGCACHGIL